MRALVVVLGVGCMVAIGVAPGCSCGQRATLAVTVDGGVLGAEGHDAGGHEAGGPDGAGRDSGRSDGGGDAGTCAEPRTWRLEPRQVASVQLVDGPVRRMGATERLAVGVRLASDCDVLGRVELVPTADEGCCTDEWQVSAWAWTADGCQPVDGLSATWIVTIPGRAQGNSKAVVWWEDTQAGACIILLDYTREPCSGSSSCQCDATTPPGRTPEGSKCTTDCDCAPGLSCIAFAFGFAGMPSWACLRPCNDVLDCGSVGMCRSQVEGPVMVCEGSDQCSSDADCPVGFRCIPGDDHTFCLDERPFITGQRCECDAVCPLGQHCVSATADVATCEIFCRRDADCPSGLSQIAYGCASDSRCRPLSNRGGDRDRRRTP